MFYNAEEWAKTRETIIGLYPKWNLTGDQATVFREQFQKMHQPTLREAVKQLWLEDKFSNTSLNPGKLRAMYGRVRAENEAAAQRRKPESSEEYDWDEINNSRQNALRQVLMAPIAAVSAAADTVRRGIGRWAMLRPQQSSGNDPTQWSAMMRAAVLYEMDNPSKEAGDDADKGSVGQRKPLSRGVDKHESGGGGDGLQQASHHGGDPQGEDRSHDGGIRQHPPSDLEGGADLLAYVDGPEEEGGRSPSP